MATLASPILLLSPLLLSMIDLSLSMSLHVAVVLRPVISRALYLGLTLIDVVLVLSEVSAQENLGLCLIYYKTGKSNTIEIGNTLIAISSTREMERMMTIEYIKINP